MKENSKLETMDALELMLRWNRYCDANDREGDCILLNEDRTYREAFASVEEAKKEIINFNELQRNQGFLIPVYADDGKYRGMKWVLESDIGEYIDLDMIEG